MINSPQATRSPVGLRLVTVSHFFPAHGGGLEKVAEKLVNGLANQGFHIRWFSSNTDPAPGLAPGIEAISVSTSNAMERLTQLPYPLWSLFELPRLWREIGGAHAVHVHEHLYCPSIAAIAIARLRRCPVVITQHMGALALGSRISTWLYETGARALGWILFPAAARTVFISHNVRRFFRRENSRRAQLIFNGVDTHRFVPARTEDRTALRKQLGLPQDRPIVLFVGRFVRKKGIHRVAGLARRFPHLLWIFAGSGPETPDNSLPNVLVAGRVEHDQLPRYYQAADLLILPSAGEGLPLVVQEALCCGTAILSTEEVASACPDAADMIRARPVPREHDDLDGWEKALREILDSPDHLNEGSRMERSRRARALWSWERCISQYAQLFQSVAKVS